MISNRVCTTYRRIRSEKKSDLKRKLKRKLPNKRSCKSNNNSMGLKITSKCKRKMINPKSHKGRRAMTQKKCRRKVWTSSKTHSSPNKIWSLRN